ncbi:MAG: glycerol kinase, partial [Clostridia bacterium]|nr:glycerol kinase [Clostridia bacterium]
KVSRLEVEGGASANTFLMQFPADITGCEAVRPKVAESTAQGAAYLAGIACGFWQMSDVQSLSEADRTFIPSMAEEKRARLLDGWQKAVRQTLAK